MTNLSDTPQVWSEAAPFRAWAQTLLKETGLHWRLLAAHLGVSPAAMHRLLTTRQERIHVTLARSLMSTTPEEIKQAPHLRVPADETRRLLHALANLGYRDHELSQWLTARDLHIATSRALYCYRDTAVRVQACYDLLTHIPATRRDHTAYPALSRKGA